MHKAISFFYTESIGGAKNPEQMKRRNNEVIENKIQNKTRTEKAKNYTQYLSQVNEMETH